jgi:hypothetical protein
MWGWKWGDTEANERMLATPHMLAGAAIGKVLRRPYLALPAAFASHFVLDAVPHLDSHALFGVPHGGPTAPEAIMAVVDVVVGVALVLWLSAGQSGRGLVIWAAFFGIVTDLLDNVPGVNTLFHELPGALSFSAFHHDLQHNVTPAQWPLGVSTQLVVVAVAIWVLRKPHSADGKAD